MSEEILMTFVLLSMVGLLLVLIWTVADFDDLDAAKDATKLTLAIVFFFIGFFSLAILGIE